MLIIDTTQLSTLYVTATEKVTLSPPYYFLLSLNNREERDITYNILVTDLSSFPTRYNEFAITTAQSANWEKGEYEYTIYAQSSAVNTDPTLANESVETGILKIK
jgi:hypothetical protein